VSDIAPQPVTPQPVDMWDRLGVVLITLTGALAGLLELFLVPLYAGSVVVPVAVLFAGVGNVVLPRMARTLVPRTVAALAPFLGWLIVVVGVGVFTRPEGDVVLPGSPRGLEYVVYGLLLVGVLAGTVSVVLAIPPPSRSQTGGNAITRR
jgi:hypothetical protein